LIIENKIVKIKLRNFLTSKKYSTSRN